MSLLKEISIETIRKMPEESSAEDIMYEIDVIAHVLEGLKDSEEGRTIEMEVERDTKTFKYKFQLKKIL